MLYATQAVMLDRIKHANHKIKPLENYAFMAKQHAIPITLNEISMAAMEYPLVFAEGDTQPVLLAIFGLRPQENLQVSNGHWCTRYIPAEIRAYPFTPIRSAEDRLSLGVDSQCPAFNTQEGQALFTAEGEPTPHLEQAFDFAAAHYENSQHTDQFCQTLKELQLLTPQRLEVKIRSTGEALEVEGFWCVDEKKFYGLDAATLKKLQMQGYLAWVYAHLLSLRNFEILVERLNEKIALEEPKS